MAHATDIERSPSVASAGTRDPMKRKTTNSPRLSTKVITLRQAGEFIRRHHRHHPPTVGHKFSLGVRVRGTDDLVGVAVVGRPLAEAYDDGDTLEVLRTCTDGTRNANSALYGATWRASKAIGAARLLTYTQDGESGASLRAAGWRAIGERKPRAGWNSPSRARKDEHPTDITRTLWLIGEDFPARDETPAQLGDLSSHACRCGAPPPPRPTTGRRPRYCSQACRQAAYRDRQRRTA